MKPKDSRTEKSVLVVDDDHHIRASLARLLVARGWTVRTEPDGMRAVQALRAFCFSAIVVDENMPGGPGMAGAALLEHARGVCPDTHLVLLSGWPSKWARDKTIGLGGYVVEKGDVLELLKLLDNLPVMVSHSKDP
jgi:CheY-like chemotaxis protein